MVQIHPGAPILFEAIAKTEKRWPAKPVIRRFDSASPLHVLVAERIRTGLRNQHPYGIESSNLSGDTKFFCGFPKVPLYGRQPVLKTGVRESVGVRFFHLRPLLFFGERGGWRPTALLMRRQSVMAQRGSIPRLSAINYG